MGTKKVYKVLASLIISLVGLFLASSQASAATLYWVGSDGANASVASNWKTTNPTTCGSGDSGAAPSSADAVVFDADCDNGAVIDSSFAATITSLNMNSGYAGTVTLATSLQTTSTFTISGGTFNAVSYTLDVDSTFAMNNAAATFRASSGNMTIVGFSVSSGTWDKDTNGGGTVTFDGAGSTLSCTGVTFNRVNLSHSSSSVKVINSSCSLPLGDSPTVTGGVTLSGTLTGTGTVTFSGSGTTTLSAGSAITGFTGITTVSGGFTVAGATADFSSLSSFITGSTLTISSGTLTLPSGADLNGALVISGGTFNAPSGNMTLAGNLTISNSPTFNANGGTIIIDGTTTGTLSCNSVTFNRVVFANDDQAGAVKTVSNNCTLPLGHDPTITGRFRLNSATASVVGTGVLTSTSTVSSAFRVTNGSVTGFTGLIVYGSVLLDGGTLDLSNYTSVVIYGQSTTQSLSISTGTFTAPSGTMTLYDTFNFTGSGTFNHNNGTVVFASLDGVDTSAGFSGGGDITVNHLTWETTEDSTMRFNEEAMHTVLGNLRLVGNVGNLDLRSQVAGTQYYLDVRGTRTLINLDVQDSNNINSTEMIGASLIDSGNNTGWNFDSQPITLEIDSPSSNSYTNSDRPAFRWKAASPAGTNSSISSYQLQMVGEGSYAGFILNSIPANPPSDQNTYVQNKYTVTYENFTDNDTTNNYINVVTNSSNEWSSDEKDGKVVPGKRSFRVTAYDGASNNVQVSRTFFVDQTAPTLALTQINDKPMDGAASVSVSLGKPTIYGRITDALLDSSNIDDKIASGPKEYTVTIEKPNLLGSHSEVVTETISLSTTYWENTGAEITDTVQQQSNKYATFAFSPKTALANGRYRLTFTGKDVAGNSSSAVTLALMIGGRQDKINSTDTSETTPIIKKPISGPAPQASPVITPSTEPSPLPSSKPETAPPLPTTEPAATPQPLIFAQNIVKGVVDFFKGLFRW